MSMKVKALCALGLAMGMGVATVPMCSYAATFDEKHLTASVTVDSYIDLEATDTAMTVTDFKPGTTLGNSSNATVTLTTNAGKADLQAKVAEDATNNPTNTTDLYISKDDTSASIPAAAGIDEATDNGWCLRANATQDNSSATCHKLLTTYASVYSNSSITTGSQVVYVDFLVAALPTLKPATYQQKIDLIAYDNIGA